VNPQIHTPKSAKSAALSEWARRSVQSLGLSLQIGIGATIVATILGTMIVFGLGRYRFRGRGSSNLPGHR